MMRNICSVIVVIAVVAVVILFGRHSHSGDDKMRRVSLEGRHPQIYTGLRKQALAMTPAALGLSIDAKSKEPYGILMELAFPDSATVTLACFATGDASLYLSTGGGVLGGIGHASVRAAAKRFVSRAASYVDKMQPAASYPLPAPGRVEFYVLTPAGVLTAEAGEEDLGTGRNELSELFNAGQDVITQLRLISQNKP